MSGAISVTALCIWTCTALFESTVNSKTATQLWIASDINPDSFLRPYSPHMSLTATGFDVTSSGGSLGGLMVSQTFWTNDLYHGSSTSAASKRCRWTSAAMAE